jgi:hypothetical protein
MGSSNIVSFYPNGGRSYWIFAGAARVCWRRRREFLIEILGKREKINFESLY